MRRIVAFALSMGLAFQAHAQRHYDPDQFGAPPPVAQAQAKGPYLFDLPKRFPTAFNLWQQSIPRALDLPAWLAKFDGVAGPIQDVIIDGKQMKFGTVCMPHDCGDNIAGVMFSPQQDRIVAVVHMAGQNQVQTLMVVGAMSGAEYSCVQKLMQVGATTC